MKLDYRGLLAKLVEAEVDFIVVGGVAAILEGAPVTTLDVDVVVERSAANLERLAVALAGVHARYRDPAGRLFLPTLERLSTVKTSLLLTDLGPLDVLSTIGAGEDFEALAGAASPVDLGGLTVQVLSLERVIASKEHAGREKDRAVLPVLRRTLELKRRK